MFRVSCFGSRDSSFGSRVSGFRNRDSGFGYQPDESAERLDRPEDLCDHGRLVVRPAKEGRLLLPANDLLLQVRDRRGLYYNRSVAVEKSTTPNMSLEGVEYL